MTYSTCRIRQTCAREGTSGADGTPNRVEADGNLWESVESRRSEADKSPSERWLSELKKPNFKGSPKPGQAEDGTAARTRQEDSPSGVAGISSALNKPGGKGEGFRSGWDCAPEPEASD